MRPEKLYLYKYTGDDHTEDQEFAFLHGVQFAIGQRDPAKPDEYNADEENGPNDLEAYEFGVEFGHKCRELIYTMHFNIFTHTADVFLTAPIYPYTSTVPMSETELRQVFAFPEE